MTYAVETIGLSKRYRAGTAVEDLGLRVPRGAVYGFLGPNGSGKSTTMKMLLSLVRPTSGDILVRGRPMTRSTRREQLAHIGALIESPPGYGHLTGAENLRIVRRMTDASADDVTRAVSAVHMDEQMDKKVREYSLGMKQRLGIAMALAKRPDLLILDEPTNGLDPAGIEEIRRLLRTLADRGITVMVSSHLLGEIDRTATFLGILSRGRLLFQGTRAELMSASAPDLLIECSDPARAATILSEYTRVGAERDQDRVLLRVPGTSRDATAHLVSVLVHGGIGVNEVRHEDRTLEEMFMDLTREGRL